MNEAMAKIPAAEKDARMRESFGQTRAYFGTTREGAARLELSYGEGRPRIVMEAPSNGKPSFFAIDEQGNSKTVEFK